MIRNLKVLGLALVAIFALSAMVASAASAQSETQGELTTETGEAVTLDGVEDGTNYFKYPGLPGQVECPESEVTGHKTLTKPETEAGKTHELIPNGSTAVTGTLDLKPCKNGTSTVTVTMNGCDFDLQIGNTTEPVVGSEYKVTASIVCPTNKQIEVHQYFASNNENTLTCTVKVPAQEGITGFDITNDPEVERLTLTGLSKNVKASKEGLCGANSTEAAEQQINYTIRGTDAVGNPLGVTVTDKST